MKGLIIHSSLAGSLSGDFHGVFNGGQRRGGEARVCTDVVRLKSGRVSRALFPRPSSPARLDTRGNREITPSKQCTQGLREERFKVISPLIRSEIPTLDPAVPDFSTDHSIPSRVEWLLARLVGGGIAGRRSFHC